MLCLLDTKLGMHYKFVTSVNKTYNKQMSYMSLHFKRIQVKVSASQTFTTQTGA